MKFGVNSCASDQSILSSVAGGYTGSIYDKVIALKEKSHKSSKYQKQNKDIDVSLEQLNIYKMKYFLQESSEKERTERNFYLFCGICTNIEDIYILRELHFEYWK